MIILKKLDNLNIPKPILYDDKLNLSEKFILSIITGILRHNEKCFASNSYFSQLSSLSERTVYSVLCKLKEEKYISFGGTRLRRTIDIINPKLIEIISESSEKFSAGSEKSSSSSENSSTYNNNDNNNKNNNYRFFNKQNENFSSYNDKPSYDLAELMKIK